MYSLKGGLQTLTDRLAESVQEMGGYLKLNSSVSSLQFQSGKAKVPVYNIISFIIKEKCSYK